MASVPYSQSTDLSVGSTIGIYTVTFYLNLATLADGDVITNWMPAHDGDILSLNFIVHTPVTTAAKACTLNLEVGSTNLTGGVLALTSANCTPRGNRVTATTITGNNTFTASDGISLEASSTTAFAEGSGWVIIRVRNTNVRDAIAASSGGLRS